MTTLGPTDPLPPGTVLVADELRGLGGPDVGCPAATLIEGELRRQGVPSVRGVLDVAVDRTNTDATWSTVGDTGLGVVVRHGDHKARLAARSAVSAWVAVSGPRSVVLAAPRSFCAGVERAVQVVERALDRQDEPVYVRKQIVHNTHVVADLEARGAVFVDELDAVPDQSTVVFSAHGVSPAVRTDAAARGMAVIDATCPLVTKVHAEARRFAGRGDTVILIGHAGHEEVEGTLGEVPDRTVLVESVADVATVDIPDPTRVSYLTQTTLAVDETTDIIDALHARFPALRGPGSDDICYATTNRQDSLRAVAAVSDLVLVVGSTNSSNSLRLVELSKRQGTKAFLIDDVRDIRPQWLAGTKTIGLTAGASAPPHLVDEVIATLRGLGPVEVSEHETARETIQFTLPSPVRHTS
ncbi:4-hydroxy-3-methylbut-2-enyl diphosphate reductase [Actinokineospora sp. NBRC 105648]|uniref:4-hydroxy-3-methylbut-2-enyl diphosphate reductase n=1 Tax=Actinokineospora sp. NBRC 105648 TaxID=3032206 RepID=UPI0024A34E4E|nr:4-hydroxy-3-methylbut-2-enyl diphosphate reductase [Actinokineospora sp. NBRC 105648]GLZ36448.1 4-hydroxy-3-methylbut-2-enyl diphosphate reductase 2 [Actinokineospora sp. NBRC 105648]